MADALSAGRALPNCDELADTMAEYEAARKDLIAKTNARTAWVCSHYFLCGMTVRPGAVLETESVFVVLKMFWNVLGNL